MVIAALACLIMGDSIADGVARAFSQLGGSRCAVVAKQGATTSWVAAANPGLPAVTAVLSAGSNDADAPDLQRRVALLRASVAADRVIWLLPYDRRAAGIVRSLAAAHGDGWIDLAGQPSVDGIHPRTYFELARATQAAIAGASLDAVASPGMASAHDAASVPSWVATPAPPSVLVFR